MLKEPAKQAVRQIFSGDLYYDIPRFQRSYIWSENQVEDLLNDINDSEEDYFIGSAIIYNEDENDRKYIIDGQQRITTLTILLSQIRNRFHDLGDIESANEIDKLVKDRHPKKPRSAPKEYRLQNSGANKSVTAYLQDHILAFQDSKVLDSSKRINKMNSEVNTFAKNCSFIRDYIDELLHGFDEISSKLDELDKFKIKVLNSSIILIIADNFSEGYQIFSTLNSRGVNLEMQDLVKAHFMQNIEKGPGRDKATLVWSNIEENLEACKKNSPRLKKESFFLDSWTVYMNEQGNPERKVYNKTAFDKSFFKSVNEENAENILKIFESYSVIYHLLFVGPSSVKINPRKEENIENIIADLRIFSVTQYSGFLLHLLNGYLRKGYIKYETVEFVLSNLIKFHFIYNGVCKDPGNRIAPKYKKHFRMLDSCQTPKENHAVSVGLVSSLSEVQSEKANFINEFSRIRYFNKYKTINSEQRRIIKFILKNISKKYLSNYNKIDFSKLTIEHIIPESRIKSPNDAWIGSIGNLFLIENDNLEDLSFAEKKYKMNKENVPYPDCIKNITNFDEHQAIKITNNYGKELYDDLCLKNGQAENYDANKSLSTTMVNSHEIQIESVSLDETRLLGLDEIFENANHISFTRLPADDGWRVEYDKERIGFCTFSKRNSTYRIYCGLTHKNYNLNKSLIYNVVEKLTDCGFTVKLKPKNTYENIIIELLSEKISSVKLKDLEIQLGIIANARHSKSLDK